MSKDNPTFGEMACGVNFNPSAHPAVDEIKRRYADICDDLNDRRNATDNPNVARMYSIAITETQTAQMWAVKAATWGYRT